MARTITDEDVETIVQRLIAVLKTTPPPTDPDPWFTRVEAAAYLNWSVSSFDHNRDKLPLPACEHPLRWSKNALDVFKMTAGGGLPYLRRRAGRKRKNVLYPPPGGGPADGVQ